MELQHHCAPYGLMVPVQHMSQRAGQELRGVVVKACRGNKLDCAMHNAAEIAKESTPPRCRQLDLVKVEGKEEAAWVYATLLHTQTSLVKQRHPYRSRSKKLGFIGSRAVWGSG